MTMNVDAAFEYICQSLSDLWQHRVTCNDDSTLCEMRHAFRNSTEVVLQLWWVNVPSAVSDQFLWDSVVVALENKSQFDGLIAKLRSRGIAPANGSIAPVRDNVFRQNIPMYQYHPQRFRAVFPVAKYIAQLAQDSAGSMFTIEAMQTIGTRHLESYNEKINSTPLRARLKADSRDLQKLIEAWLFYGEFVRNGRQIFDFPPALVEGFRRSDVEDIPLAAIKLPYDSFYLYFGPQKDLETKPGWHPDGAYVAMIGDPSGKHVIQFCLTSIPVDQSMYEAWDANPEPVYVQGIPSDLMSTGIGYAVERVLSDKIAELKKQIEGSMQREVDEAVAALSAESGARIFDQVMDVSSRKAKMELEQLPQLHQAWREMLNLVINAIAYLTSYKEDVRNEWPEKTPKNLLHQIQNGSPKEKQRAKSKLAALGYTAIHLCGTKFVEMTNRNRANVEDVGGRKPTWVRGTWVWQAHGAQWSLRRLQWRMPHVRNKDSTDETDSTGHLYLVS